MNQHCLFCSHPPKPPHKPADTVDFVCGSCVCLLADADQDDLRRAYNKATRLNMDQKATAIKMFIEEEEHELQNARPKARIEKSRRNSARRGRSQIPRRKKRKARRTSSQGSSFLPDQHTEPPVPRSRHPRFYRQHSDDSIKGALTRTHRTETTKQTPDRPGTDTPQKRTFFQSNGIDCLNPKNGQKRR